MVRLRPNLKDMALVALTLGMVVAGFALAVWAAFAALVGALHALVFFASPLKRILPTDWFPPLVLSVVSLALAGVLRGPTRAGSGTDKTAGHAALPIRFGELGRHHCSRCAGSPSPLTCTRLVPIHRAPSVLFGPTAWSRMALTTWKECDGVE